MPCKLEPPPYTIPVRPFCIAEALAGKPFISKRDWLDPDIERMARAALAKAEGKATT